MSDAVVVSESADVCELDVGVGSLVGSLVGSDTGSEGVGVGASEDVVDCGSRPKALEICEPMLPNKSGVPVDDEVGALDPAVPENDTPEVRSSVDESGVSVGVGSSFELVLDKIPPGPNVIPLAVDDGVVFSSVLEGVESVVVGWMTKGGKTPVEEDESELSDESTSSVEDNFESDEPVLELLEDASVGVGAGGTTLVLVIMTVTTPSSVAESVGNKGERILSNGPPDPVVPGFKKSPKSLFVEDDDEEREEVDESCVVSLGVGVVEFVNI